MRTHSTRWSTAIRQAHTVAVVVDVLYGRATILSGLAVLTGSVTIDRTASQLARCALTFAEPAHVGSVTGPLSPFGYEVAIRRGIRYLDGTTETMALGVFPIQTSNVDGVTLGTAIAGVDRSQLVADARLEGDYQIAAGTNYAAAITALIQAGVDGLTYSFTSTTFTTPLLTFPAQSDRWDSARQMATAIGCDLYFDGDGVCVLRPTTILAGAPTPAWTLREGVDGVMVSLQRNQDRGPAYNRVIAFGSNASLGIVPRGVWTDIAPSSPTQYNPSRFGRKPQFYASPFLSTNLQAEAAAASIGANIKGVAASVNFGAVPDPALEPGDVILVERESLGLHELHVLDTLQIGLTADGSMTGTSRLIGV